MQALFAESTHGLDSRAVRARLVERLRQSGCTNPSVLGAFTAVPRHGFVETALVSQAYEDTSLPIGWGQTISKPSVIARMMELLLQNQPYIHGRVLEIGTGCGYQAAVLAKISKEVYSMERVSALHQKARDNLRPLRVPNLHLLLGDGMKGYPSGAPYAAIISAAGGQQVPTPWLEQLAVGGRLIAPTHLANGQQALVLVQRSASGWTQTVLEAVQFVPLKSGLI